jgi:REP element-mobilizing transposase RayT
MKKYFKAKYRIESTRLQSHDYSSGGHYFITINARELFFGQIAEGKMIFSDIGIIADEMWKEIPREFPSVSIDKYQVMPDHIHGIIRIKDKIGESRDAINRVSAEKQSKIAGGITGNKNPMLTDHSIGKIIRWYKGRCTFEMRKLDGSFAWQGRFHDRIIRNYEELVRVREYISANVRNW